MTTQPATLQYLIAEKGPVQVVSLIGLLTRETESILEKCAKDVLSRSATWVILNLREVPPDVERTVFRSLVQMQKTIRDADKRLRLAGIHPQLFTLLERQAIIRRDEVCKNVAEALKSLQGG